MRKIVIILSGLLLIFPIVVLAQLSGTPVAHWINTINDIVNSVIYILMGLATAVFLWGMVKYIQSGADEKAKESSKGYIKAGIIGLFLSLSIWGIVNVIARTFDVEDAGIPIGPGYKDPRGGSLIK
ncbi:MAG: pilin [Patescibacteria group bacterium]